MRGRREGPGRRCGRQEQERGIGLAAGSGRRALGGRRAQRRGGLGERVHDRPELRVGAAVRRLSERATHSCHS